MSVYLTIGVGHRGKGGESEKRLFLFESQEEFYWSHLEESGPFINQFPPVQCSEVLFFLSVFLSRVCGQLFYDCL